LHARAAAKLVALASEFESEVWLSRGDNTIDASSIMAVMMLAAGQGTELSLNADGPDEDDAVERISALIADYFGEGE
jgi:phosphocarrier protein HPr